jgi:hypothetical protein
MKDLKYYIIGATALFTIYIVANLNRPKPINWAETFVNKDKTPFGTYIIYKRVKDLFPGVTLNPRREPVYNALTNESLKESSYIIICPGIDVTKVEYGQLVKYIAKGNDVFIAASDFGTLLQKKLHIDTRADFTFQQGKTPIRFLNPALDTAKFYQLDKGCGSFYFNSIDTAKATVLGQNDSRKANFIKYRFGKGNLYLMANPKMLSNYSLLTPQGAAYAATALSYVRNTKQLLWDEYYTQGSGDAESPMRVFLSNPALSWAYYISLFSLLIFVLYEVKRRQRIIPVIAPLQNSTIDFVTVVGQVYYEKRNNANIAHKKTIYFLEYLRDQHKLKTGKLDEEFTEMMTRKTGIEPQLARNIVNAINFINTHGHITDQELIKLNYLIEQFYTQSR